MKHQFADRDPPKRFGLWEIGRGDWPGGTPAARGCPDQAKDREACEIVARRFTET
jgi:hypothetical protein